MDVIEMMLLQCSECFRFSVCSQTSILLFLYPSIHRLIDGPFPQTANSDLPRDCAIECALANAHKPARVNVAENDATPSKAAGSVGITKDGPYSTSHR